jgi:hypothetical protein
MIKARVLERFDGTLESVARGVGEPQEKLALEPRSA